MFCSHSEEERGVDHGLLGEKKGASYTSSGRSMILMRPGCHILKDSSTGNCFGEVKYPALFFRRASIHTAKKRFVQNRCRVVISRCDLLIDICDALPKWPLRYGGHA